MPFFKKKRFGNLREIIIYLFSFIALLFIEFFSFRFLLNTPESYVSNSIWLDFLPVYRWFLETYQSIHDFLLWETPSYELFFLIFLFLFFRFSYKKFGELKFNKLYFNKLFFYLHIGLVFIFFFTNLFLMKYDGFVRSHFISFNFLWGVIFALWFFSLFFSFFNLRYVLMFAKNFYKQFIVSILIAVMLRYILMFIVKIVIFLGDFAWPFLAHVTSKIVYFLLSLTFSDVFVNFGSNISEDAFPLIGVGDFVVKIARSCSGMAGISLFFLLFVFIVFLERNNVVKWKAALLLPLGMFGSLVMNVLRVYLLIVVGAVYSPEFAIGPFHNNVGWILFSTYFLVFEFLTYNWMLNKKKVKKKK